MNRWDVYRAYIHFEDDATQGKKRPILMLNVSDSQFITCKITSKYRDEELEYAVRDWRGAGLDRPSYVRLEHKVYLAPDTEMIKLGTLQKVDIDNIKILCQKYDIKLNEDLNMGKIDWNKVQWGVYQFSTDSIIFRGTKKECQIYIDDRPELWEDAEVYSMTPDDPHYIKEQDDQELEEDMEDKTYAVTVKYHNEPKERIEARLAKDREDFEYQLSMDDEVEWYDFDKSQFNEGYSKEGYSWDEVNGMIHIYENGKLIDKFPDMESAEEAGWDLEGLVEDLNEECYNINEAVAPSSSFVELEGFKRDWRDLGLNDDDLRDLQNLIINNPSSSIPLGSNVYKIRFSPERLNRGKDTANRVICIEVIKSNVIYLATAFSKSEEVNISKTEEDTLRAFAKILNK